MSEILDIKDAIEALAADKGEVVTVLIAGVEYEAVSMEGP